jgi:hypothetical protein
MSVISFGKSLILMLQVLKLRRQSTSKQYSPSSKMMMEISQPQSQSGHLATASQVALRSRKFVISVVSLSPQSPKSRCTMETICTSFFFGRNESSMGMIYTQPRNIHCTTEMMSLHQRPVCQREQPMPIVIDQWESEDSTNCRSLISL